MKVFVKFISPISMKSKSEPFVVEIADATVQVALRELIRKYGKSLEPQIFDNDGKPYTQFLVNGEVVTMESPLQDGDTLWIMPIIAGG